MLLTKLAPVVLFVYNRPEHTRQTINALAKNKLASLSELYIYADGPKDGVDEIQSSQIKEVYNIVKKVNGFKKVYIQKSESNLGLSKAIINGVTEVINKCGKVIVLEDDLVTGKGFLKYMNDALDLYENENKAGCIHGWNYLLDTKEYKASTFFLSGADCWGWGTWKRSWNLFNENGKELLENIISKKLTYTINRRNTHEFVKMLQDQIDGKNDSWAIRWHASLVLENKYCLHPSASLIRNIGLDASGTHCTSVEMKQVVSKSINVKPIPVEESEWFYQVYKDYTPKEDISQWRKLKNILSRLYHRYSVNL